MSKSVRLYCLPGTALLHRRIFRLAIALMVIVLTLLAAISMPAFAQDATTTGVLESGANTAALPSLWYLLAAGLAMLVPAGFVLLASANLAQEDAWNAALGGLAAAALALFAYWAIGYALQFGGVGLVYPHAGLRGQVWEWSPLSSEWGIGWGMAGLTGWFLSGELSALSMSLFLGHVPWVMVAGLLPVMTLRGRAPALVTLLLALMMGAIVYPLAGNWVQGGGWLNALGRNLNLGHGFVDYGGAGSVHLVSAGFALAALTVWSTRSSEAAGREVVMPPAHQPLLAVVGALLVLGGGVGWMSANPLQVETVGEYGMMRGAVSYMLAAAGGVVFPLLYTWFVTGRSEPTMSARGFVAGVVAGLACGPFVAPGIAFVVGLVAGATVPFVTFLLDGRLRVDDRTGVVISSGVPALIGLLLVGIFADGRAGSGWQMTGAGSYLGVNGQGVSGLLVGSGMQMDFPAQLQSQVIGVVALGLWGFLAGLVICVPLGLVFHSLLRRNDRPVRPAAPTVVPGTEPRLPAPETRTPTTTSTHAVPTPAYLDAPVRPAMSPQSVPTPDSTAAISTSNLPGFAPGERRAPTASNYVPPAVVAATTPAQEPSPPLTPATETALPDTNMPATPVPDTSWITPSAPADRAPSIEDAPFDTSTIAKTPREGYWPAQDDISASSIDQASLPPGSNGALRNDAPRSDAPRNGNPLTRNGRQRPAPQPDAQSDDTSAHSA